MKLTPINLSWKIENILISNHDLKTFNLNTFIFNFMKIISYF